MHCFFAGALVILALCWPVASAHSQGAKRALVIGNDNYEKLEKSKLEKARNDATAVASALKELGYSLVDDGAQLDAGQKKIQSLWRTLLNAIAPNDLIVFYFAGHGFEESGQNFLIPSDLPPMQGTTKEAKLKFLEDEAISFGKLLRDLYDKRAELRTAGKNGFLGIFIIDACRDSPVEEPGGRTRWLGAKAAGFSPVSDPGGNFILYSAEARQQALDRLHDNDTNPNSVYTRHLLPLLKRTELSLSDVAQLIKPRVYNEAQKRLPVPHSQVPAYYDGLIVQQTILGKEITEEARQARIAGLQAEIARTEPLVTPVTMAAKVSYARGLQIKPESPKDREALPTQKDCTDCPELIIVPGQAFRMGEAGRNGVPPGDGLSREVRLQHTYGIGKFEVTVGEWQACVRAKVCRRVDPGYNRAKDTDYERRPIVNVSWTDAQAYVGWLAQLTGLKYRLPSEAEWEFAARAGSGGAYSFGDKIEDLCLYANGADKNVSTWLYQGNDCDDSFGRTAAPVGRFKPNDFGLFDVHGNAWEWVADCYTARVADLPDDGKPLDLKECSLRTARGGSWMSLPDALRSSARNAFYPSHARPTLGLRVARDIID